MNLKICLLAFIGLLFTSRLQSENSRGMVSSGHPFATEAGLSVLKSGGNAIDAAVAVGLTLGVVDSHNSGIGGGCFMLIHRANTYRAWPRREPFHAHQSPRSFRSRDG